MSPNHPRNDTFVPGELSIASSGTAQRSDAIGAGSGSGATAFESVPAQEMTAGSLAMAPQRVAQELNDGAVSRESDGPEHPELSARAGQGAEARLSPVDSFSAEHAKWRESLARCGGTSSLLHFVDSPRTRLELSTTHPGGLPQFITGQKILLSRLFRDDLAFRNARLAAGAIADKAVEMRSVRGLETVHLAVGLATWERDGASFCAPVLMRPLAIRRYGADFELKLHANTFFNPALARALAEQFGMSIDPAEFVALSQASGMFKPQPVIDRLRSMTAAVPGFSVQPRLLVSSFHELAHTLLQDARNLDHPLLNAAAGSEYAREQLAREFQPATVLEHNLRAPEVDRLLLDADTEQDEVIAQIEAGQSVVVHTLPGTGGTQTVVNAIGSLIAQHRRVLVVSPRRATLDGITQRLNRVGLSGIAASPRSLRRNLIASITRNETVIPPAVTEVDDALLRLRSVILNYQVALETPDPVLAVSPLQAVQELTRLSNLPEPPVTRARLDSVALSALAHNRPAVAEDLLRAASLGQFEFGPNDSPWYGVTFRSSAEAQRAHGKAQQLHQHDLNRLLGMADALVGQTSMRPYQTLAELGVYLRLLLGIRDTLDRFTPEVYDRPLTEIIAAHASRGGDEMTPANRRRLKKLAREYVRPGVNVTDMLERLRHIEQQRLLWQRYTQLAGARPEVPVGIADAQVSYQTVFEDCATLDSVLGYTGTGRSLQQRSIPELRQAIAALAAESDVLQNIQERTALLERLRSAHLEPLLDDLSARHVPADRVALELEQAWWQSALQTLVHHNPALLKANIPTLSRLDTQFQLVDEAHAGANGQHMAAQRAAAWKIALVDYPHEAQQLRSRLQDRTADIPTLLREAPHLLDVLAPVWLASPYEVAQFGEGLVFDAVLIVDAGATLFEETIGAIRRARQVVVFGDPITQTPSPFELAVTVPQEQEHPDQDAVDDLHARSCLSVVADLLPVYTLTRSYRAGGEDLTRVVNNRFYGGKLVSLPWAGSFLGKQSLQVELVAGGSGLPDPETGAVESTDAEVQRVVELVQEHASVRPKESLMVVTVSERHAVRVYQAVLSACGQHPTLSDFLLADRAEPFTVLTLEQATAQSRDRVVFSLGYGRTPHGRMLSNFGPLGRPGGERMLAIAMTRARRAMTIVSCFSAADLDERRIRFGVAALAELLSGNEAGVAGGQVGGGSQHGIHLLEAQRAPVPRNPMLADLADRLRQLGLQVELDYQHTIPLAAGFEGKAVAVEIDFGQPSGSLREALRLRPAVLRRLGWHFLRVHSFELFRTPDAVAQRIAGVVGLNVPVAEQITEAIDG